MFMYKFGQSSLKQRWLKQLLIIKNIQRVWSKDKASKAGIALCGKQQQQKITVAISHNCYILTPLSCPSGMFLCTMCFKSPNSISKGLKSGLWLYLFLPEPFLDMFLCVL